MVKGEIMEIGIVGLKQSGKSTLFQIMTGVNSSEVYGEKFVRGTANVPDSRFDELVKIFNPKKISPAIVPFMDVNATGENPWNTIREGLSGADGLLHIIDVFSESLDKAIKNYNDLRSELIISDLGVVENKIERLKKIQAKNIKPEEVIQNNILPKAKILLEEGKPLSELELSQDDYAALKGFTFWTLKPELVILNTSEDSVNLVEEFKKQIVNVNAISICCQIESEIATLSKEEQEEFLDSMNIKTPAYEKIIQEAFSLLNQMCYFTVGEDEVKAWVLASKSTAPKAAAVIHKDFERGFIKAEVVSYADFMNNEKSMQSVKSAGKLRLEGKEYVVKDGDIISFRFNV